MSEARLLWDIEIRLAIRMANDIAQDYDDNNEPIPERQIARNQHKIDMDWHKDEVKRLVTKIIDFCLDVQGEWASVEATYAPEWTYKYKDFIQELEQEFLGEGK